MTSLFLPYWLMVIILEGLIVQHRKGVCEVDTAKQKEVKRLKETKRLCMYVYRYVYVCACMRSREIRISDIKSQQRALWTGPSFFYINKLL